ncbi:MULTISPECIES: hypothetical protein [Chryseobacterium]|uniref:Uncharacterized protein n=1 Tax=Chryseobacterium gambrini TaxID=373672 RepID=A0A1N7LF73_9FLAO|nr:MULTISPECIES: hypothetical protein [Chryseobacterium]SIS72467.1 hypothetical protein SAMN05421785_102195 [Chryseobacterium gambrini]
MTESDLIKQFYGEDFERINRSDYGIDSDGFSNFYDHGNETFLHGYEIFSFRTTRNDLVPVRPLGLGKALEDLKNNNGWYLITEKNRMPENDVWVCDFKGKKIAFLHEAFKPIPKKYTHYKTVEKPKLPLF